MPIPIERGMGSSRITRGPHQILASSRARRAAFDSLARRQGPDRSTASRADSAGEVQYERPTQSGGSPALPEGSTQPSRPRCSRAAHASLHHTAPQPARKQDDPGSDTRKQAISVVPGPNLGTLREHLRKRRMPQNGRKRPNHAGSWDSCYAIATLAIPQGRERTRISCASPSLRLDCTSRVGDMHSAVPGHRRAGSACRFGVRIVRAAAVGDLVKVELEGIQPEP